MVLAGVVGLWAPPAGAQYFNSGSTGADGAFTPSCTPTPCTVTVTLPASGVFHYTTVSVPFGVTVKYTRNAANTPVTILATGNVTIAGTIDISGSNGGAGAMGTLLAPNRGVGGPGGFDGGNGANGLAGSTGGDGVGPGGGGGGVQYGAPPPGLPRAGGGASYLTAGDAGFVGGAAGSLYGTPTLVPLMGGSGGGGGAGWVGNSTGSGGGGGGGAMVLAAGTSAAAATITVNGSITAKGGNGGPRGPSASWIEGGSGSGGGVRLTAHNIAGTGLIDVTGGPANPKGGLGRIRLETTNYTGPLNLWGGIPPSSVSFASAPAPPTATNLPALTITAVGGVSAPGTLTGSFAVPDFVLPAGTSNPTVTFAASNIPLGTALSVLVQGQNGGVISTATSGGLSGTVASSTATASVTIPTTQASLISASASFTVADAGGGPLYADGESVERVVVTARLGGGSEVRYVTASGRAIVVAAAR
jgi:hypothetical protein